MCSRAACSGPSSMPWRAQMPLERRSLRTILASLARTPRPDADSSPKRARPEERLTIETERPPGTGRIEAFSDGVIAIIITIMVLELQLPADLFTGGHLQEQLAAFWPRLVVYALSFL